MRVQIQAGLIAATLLMVLWGIGLLISGQTVHSALSTGDYDPASTMLLAMAFLGFGLMSLIVSQQPRADMVKAIAVILLGFVLVIGYQMLISGGLLQNGLVFISLALSLALAVFLYVAQSVDSAQDMPQTVVPVRTTAPATKASTSRPVAKKAAKKVAKKQAAKKVVKKVAKKKAVKKK